MFWINQQICTYVFFVEGRRGTSRGLFYELFSSRSVEERRGDMFGFASSKSVEGLFLWIVFVEERRGTSRRLFNNIQVSRNMFFKIYFYLFLCILIVFLLFWAFFYCFDFFLLFLIVFYGFEFFFYWFLLKCMNFNDVRDFALHSWLRPF